MNRLNLSPFPSLRSDEASSIPRIEKDGFVDDDVVLALVAGTSPSRSSADPGDLALAADDMDFAGWCLPGRMRSPAPELKELKGAPYEFTRRPAPPQQEEPGLGEPHHGSHRWWLAGLAGALSTMLFSVLLLSLSARSASDADGLSIIRLRDKPKVSPASVPETPPAAPELTDVSDK